MQTDDNNAIFIRPAIPEDYKSCRVLANQKENRPGLGFVSRIVFEEFATKQKSDARYMLLVAENQSGDIFGFVRALRRLDGTQTTIHEICRDIHAKGTGVGKLLLNEIESRSKNAGIAKVFLKTPEDIPANRAYLRHGFNLVARETPQQNPRLKRTLNHYQKLV